MCDKSTLNCRPPAQEEHPQQWQHAVEAAAGLLRAEVAALGEQQGIKAEGLTTVKDVLADVAATAGAAQAAIASLQVGDH